MQAPDAPPAVVEGETGGGVVAVPEAVAETPLPAINNRPAAFTARPWTTAIGPPWPVAITAPALDASAPVLPTLIRSRSPSPCRCAKTLLRKSSHLWTI